MGQTRITEYLSILGLTRKRTTARMAERAREEPDISPAAWAQAGGSVGLFVATDALRRIEQIQDGLKDYLPLFPANT